LNSNGKVRLKRLKINLTLIMHNCSIGDLVEKESDAVAEIPISKAIDELEVLLNILKNENCIDI